MPNHDDIYKNQAQQYERLIAREDYEGNILRTITSLVADLQHLEVVDIGAGTGRLSYLLAPRVNSIIATDQSKAMLTVAEDKLRGLGLSNFRTVVADHKALPLGDHSADLITAGWTICYSTNSDVVGWQRNLETILCELERVVRPNGIVIIFENFGTGSTQPNPPDFLTSYYCMLENHYGFSHTMIRTDSRYHSVAEAEELCRFFFGDVITDRVVAANSPIVPACTGVWWRQYR
jgi:ubiquinone/menaquinone biosynthesis C-methylase UbiE